MFEVRDVTIHNKARAMVLAPISFSIEDRSCLVIIGSNGSGKTTLLEVIAGLRQDSTGHISNGKSAKWRNIPVDPRDALRHGIVFIPASDHIFAGLTVRENLNIGLPRNLWGQSEIDLMNKYFSLLMHRGEQLANTLSGGEMRTLAIARGVLHLRKMQLQESLSEGIMLIDEPSSGLDREAQKHICSLLHELSATGITMIVAEQSGTFASSIATKILVMDEGRSKWFSDATAFENDSSSEALTGEVLCGR